MSARMMCTTNDDGVCRPPRRRRRGGVRRRAAKAPATQPTADGQARNLTMARSVAHSAGVVARLRAGRTLARLRTLMDWHLFQKAPHQAEHELLLPAPGLFAKVEPSQYVFIIGTYTRYGAPMADVIALRPQPGLSASTRRFKAFLSSVRSVPQADLVVVGLHFKLVTKARRPTNLRTLIFERIGPERLTRMWMPNSPDAWLLLSGPNRR